MVNSHDNDNKKGRPGTPSFLTTPSPSASLLSQLLNSDAPRSANLDTEQVFGALCTNVACHLLVSTLRSAPGIFVKTSDDRVGVSVFGVINNLGGKVTKPIPGEEPYIFTFPSPEETYDVLYTELRRKYFAALSKASPDKLGMEKPFEFNEVELCAAQIIAVNMMLLAIAIRYDLDAKYDLGRVEGWASEIELFTEELVPVWGWTEEAHKLNKKAFASKDCPHSAGDFVVATKDKHSPLRRPPEAASTDKTKRCSSGTQVDFTRLFCYMHFEGYDGVRRLTKENGEPSKYVAMLFSIPDSDEVVAVLDTAVCDHALFILKGPEKDLLQLAQLERKEIRGSANYFVRRLIHGGDWRTKVEKAIAQARKVGVEAVAVV